MDIELLASEAAIPRSLAVEYISQKPTGDAVILTGIDTAQELIDGGVRIVSADGVECHLPDADLVGSADPGQYPIPGDEHSA
jgi:hypothetical protein